MVQGKIWRERRGEGVVVAQREGNNSKKKKNVTLVWMCSVVRRGGRMM